MPPITLPIAVVQLAIEPTLALNRDKIAAFVAEAGRRGCRAVVFPEGALQAEPDATRTQIDAALADIRSAAAEHHIYVILGLLYRRTDDEPLYNRCLVFDPAGQTIYEYDKLFGDPRFDRAPGLFEIDGIPCHVAICADRWIRAVEDLPVFAGSRISIEISNNYHEEWIPELGWYWYVPRAIRNGTHVILCNSARESPGRLARLESYGHGHSAIIAPDGSFLAAAGEESDALLVADLDLANSTAAEATRRHRHPLFKPFWDAGLRLLRGEPLPSTGYQPPSTPERTLTLAAAQLACSRTAEDNVEAMLRLLHDARLADADLVVFPELALTGALAEDICAATPSTLDAAIGRIQAAASAERVGVAFGAPFVGESGRRHNSAFVVGPNGRLLTRYDQLVVDRPDLFEPGASTRAMWFDLNGIPGVVTVGDDARWSELGELAAVRGAQLHLHLAYDQHLGEQAALRRQQFWVNLATWYTFTATVNAASPEALPNPSAPAAGGSVIWNDFRPSHLHGRQVNGGRRWCAVPVAQAASSEQLITAAATLPPVNLHFAAMTEVTLPSFRPWWEIGAEVVHKECARDQTR